jgi:hypothetical protein
MTLDARYPVALLPVRLETRFDGHLLKVRIYPDEIFADTHEPGLTPEERADGQAYVEATHAGSAAEEEAWGRLVARWGAPRAAFVAKAAAAESTEARAESWTRAAQATLPERWIVRAYQGSNAYTKTSEPVQRPLALTLSPSSAPDDRVVISDDLAIDSEIKWTVDYAAAEVAGMAVTIDLTAPDASPASPPDPAAGVDMLVVVGISESVDPADGARELHDLVDAHHYTRGLAFLKPGLPTNNTPDAPADFPPLDPGGATSFAVERGAPLVDATSSPGANGLLFARALGLVSQTDPAAAVEHLEDANLDGDAAAAAMNDAIWPATLGYYLEQLMAPRFDAATVDAAHRFWVDHVRPGGPLPAFRIGRVPYGLLPAVSVDRLADGQFVGALRVLRDRHFVPALTGVPHVGAGSPDPDGDLLKILAMDASSHIVRMRILLGQELTTNTAGFLGAIASAEEQTRQVTRVAAAAALLGTFQIAGDTRLGTFDGGQLDELIGAPLVTAAPLSEEVGLAGADGQGLNYIRWLHDNAIANKDAVKNDGLPGRSRPLLYRVLRHSLLVEMDRIAFRQLLNSNVVQAVERVEPELVRLAPSEPRLTSYQRIDRAVISPGFASQLAPYLARLAAIADLPTAELERRFGETLDACSHRLDAWITAAATRRLWAMRDTTPSGCHVGGFGWAEDVRPTTAGASLGGYIHAPSSAQASSAAILRNGYLSRGGTGSPYDVDLSSARVRAALVLLDGTRQGEPLSGLLGQQFERDLHVRQLEPLIAPLRGHFPLVAGKTPEGDGPTELVGARNVVDGLALRKAWNDNAPPFSGTSDLPALSATQLESFHAALDSLNEAVDAVADVLTAESIFQAVNGNPMAAAASLDAMAQGVASPRIDVVRTPLSGRSFAQRLVVGFDSRAPAAGAWGPRTPRAAAEPVLDDWVGTLLGPPSKIGCRVRLPNGTLQPVKLDALKLRPLDLVALSRTQPSGLGDGELDRRVLGAANAPAGSEVLYDSSPVGLTLAEAVELARAVGELLAVARPLAPADLVLAADAGAAAPTPGQAAEAVSRAQTAVGQLHVATDALDQAVAPVAAAAADATLPAPTAAQLAKLVTALRGAASFGIAGSYPSNDAGAAELLALAAAAKEEISARQAAAPLLTATDPAALVTAAIEAARAVFGRDFLLLPQLAAPALEDPLAGSAALVGEPALPRQALQQVARVRPNIGRWRSLWLYGQALGAAAPALEVAQLPPAQAWAGRPGAEIPQGTLSLIVHRPAQASPKRWAGLVVDDWTETVPSAVQHTAVSFRYEAPVAEAPQVVLLAVPPTDAASWDTETLIDTVRETLTLAKIRAVDSPLLESLRPFLPAICLTGNTANETVSTDLLGSIVAEAVLVKST